MTTFSNFRAELKSISLGGHSAETIDALALDLTAHLTDHDAKLAAMFADDVSSPIYQAREPDMMQFVPIAADFFAKDHGTAPAITIKATASKCYTLAVLLARGKA